MANSTVFAAKAIEVDIARRLRAGQSAAQIRAYLVSRYGTATLESPPTHGLSGLVWALPIVIVPAAVVASIVGVRRHRPGLGRLVSEADRALVAAALAPPPPAAGSGGPTAGAESPGRPADVDPGPSPQPGSAGADSSHSRRAMRESPDQRAAPTNQPPRPSPRRPGARRGLLRSRRRRSMSDNYGQWALVAFDVALVGCSVPAAGTTGGCSAGCGRS